MIVDSVQRKKTRFCEKFNADICLYKWICQKNTETGAILKAQVLQFNKIADGDQTFKSFGEWL